MVQTWTGVDVRLFEFDTAVDLTGISQASPAVVSHGGTDPTDGDFVFMTVQGMRELNGLFARVAGSAAGSFNVEGQDSTNYSAYTGGSFRRGINPVSFATITDLSASGGDTNTAATTTIHSLFETTIPTTTTAIEYGITAQWDITDAGNTAAQRLSARREQVGMVFTWPNGNTAAFAGFITASGAPTGSAQDVVTTPMSMTVAGEFSYYAS